VLIACLKIFYDVIPGVSQETSWTLTNMTYMFGSYIMFHHVRGVPFDFNSGAFDNLNMWEQIDNGAQYTPTKKFLLSVPIVLFLLSTHYTHYDLAYFVINFLAVLGVVIPKLPFVRTGNSALVLAPSMALPGLGNMHSSSFTTQNINVTQKCTHANLPDYCRVTECVSVSSQESPKNRRKTGHKGTMLWLARFSIKLQSGLEGLWYTCRKRGERGDIVFLVHNVLPSEHVVHCFCSRLSRIWWFSVSSRGQKLDFDQRSSGSFYVSPATLPAPSRTMMRWTGTIDFSR
jgi:hypothetical protein